MVQLVFFFLALPAFLPLALLADFLDAFFLATAFLAPLADFDVLEEPLFLGTIGFGTGPPE